MNPLSILKLLRSAAGLFAWAALAMAIAGCSSTSSISSNEPLTVTARPPLAVVAEFPHQQVTGVAVSRTGRVFVNFPYWSDGHLASVVELGPNGEQRPYPDADWNRQTADPADRFVCVQSVYVDDTDNLWIVDAGAPKQTRVVPGGAKLIKVDLASNRVVELIPFDPQIAPGKSYLNDVRVDTRNGYAFLTDSNLGAIVVVNVNTKTARRVLENDPSVKPEPNLQLRVEGNVLVDPEKDRPVAIASDGLAIDPTGGWLYYKALTGHTLYRIPLRVLEDGQMADDDLANRIERVGQVPASDGLFFHDGQIYLTAIEEDAVVRFDPERKTSEIVTHDSRLKWPDSLAFGPDGSLYVTTSQIHLTPRFNEGATRVREPFRVLKLNAGEMGRTQNVAE